jgi:hypothetical protein
MLISLQSTIQKIGVKEKIIVKYLFLIEKIITFYHTKSRVEFTMSSPMEVGFYLVSKMESG